MIYWKLTPPFTIVLISPLQLVELVAKNNIIIGSNWSWILNIYWRRSGNEHPKSSIIVYL